MEVERRLNVGKEGGVLTCLLLELGSYTVRDPVTLCDANRDAQICSIATLDPTRVRTKSR